jgi:electron transfer flavoprotein alpha subunit
VSVLVCTWGLGRNGGVPGGTEEVLTLARRIAPEVGWVIVGEAPAGAAEVASRHGVATLDRLVDPRLAAFEADAFVAALARYAEEHAFRVVLLPQTFDARLVAPRLAARLDAAVVMNGLDVAVAGDALAVTASAYGGDTRVVYEVEGRAVLGINVGGLVAEPAAQPSDPVRRDVDAHLGEATARIQVVARSEATGPRIEDADVIVAGGRGLGAKENYRLVQELADALGGMAAASRPIVDEGWAEPARQVGLTGKITRPALYVAAGISGASQHMVGCAAAKTLVAINRDPEAAIFRYARYGIVGDCLEILPALVRAVKG